jgi:hypothetical protein
MRSPSASRAAVDVGGERAERRAERRAARRPRRAVRLVYALQGEHSHDPLVLPHVRQEIPRRVLGPRRGFLAKRESRARLGAERAKRHAERLDFLVPFNHRGRVRPRDAL